MIVPQHVPLEDGDVPPLRSLYVGSIGQRLPQEKATCLQCGVDCTSLHASIWMRRGENGGGCWRTFCLVHAHALAERQGRYAERRLRELGHG